MTESSGVRNRLAREISTVPFDGRLCAEIRHRSKDSLGIMSLRNIRDYWAIMPILSLADS